MKIRSLAPMAAALLIPCASARAASSVNWPFDLTTTGNDVFFTSSTATDPTAPQFDTTYEITLVEVYVHWAIFDLGPFDVTDQIPPDQRTGNELIDGPAPVGVANVSFAYPPPPDPVGFAGTVAISIDGSGFGHGSLTDVTLGTIDFDIGGGNIQTVDLTSVRMVGSVTVQPIFAPGDLNEDGHVNVTDLFQLLAAWGDCPQPCPPSCAGDLNDDCTIDVSDLFQLLANWG